MSFYVEKYIAAKKLFDCEERLSALVSSENPEDLNELYRGIRDISPASNQVIPHLFSTITSEVLSLHSLGRLSEFGVHRDLGHLSAILRRHEIEVAAIPLLERALIEFSNKVQEVPRDTVFTYGPRNCDTVFRQFTNFDYETTFIESFRKGMGGLKRSITALLSIIIGQKSVQEGVQEAVSEFNLMTSAIVNVHKNILPEQFTFGLRPFFDPVTVSGKSYLAPGGAQMPIIMIDYLLYGQGYLNEFGGYAAENIEYMPHNIRKAFMHVMGNTTTLSDFCRWSNVDEKELEPMKKALYRFRTPHLMVAKANFQLRSDQMVGSGGYNPDILIKLSTK